MSDWPFTWLELTAGLRRYLADPTLRVVNVCEEPPPLALGATPVRGVGIDVERYGHPEHYSYLVTRPPEVRFGLSGGGKSEVGFFRSQTFPLPIDLPELVTADPAGTWVMLEPYPPRYPAEEWLPADYSQAVLDLASFQDRYWAMEDDLATYPWVAFPLKNHFVTIILAAAQALPTIIQEGRPELISGSRDHLATLARLITQADGIAEFLKTTPQTLLHGNYWPGSISIDEDGRRVIYDWQSVSVGPGVLDLASFVIKSQVYCGLPQASAYELIMLYRYKLAIQVRQVWSETEWQKLWDYALMWRFLQEQLLTWADPQTPLDEARDKLIEKLWLGPVTQAAGRWLPDYSFG
jgi:hypothetical protein